ncbi:MAG: hypothetical protein HXY28_08195 [Hydrogenophilaceae bacterium]|jgi:hypothetical protein|nr:hypothetical protein [Hydrogenophilaceae bacterium]
MIRFTTRMAAMGLAVLAMTGCASSSGSRDDDSRGDRTRRGFADAATSPLRDVGLIRPDIPEILEQLKYPYSTTNLVGGCPTILYEIGQLDAVLGEEDFQPPEERTMTQRGADEASNAAVNAAGDVAGDAVPFRSWVRRLSGAQRAQRRYAEAISMGQTRRAFLRGYGASLGCRAVVPAPPPPETARREAREEQERANPHPAGVGSPP